MPQMTIRRMRIALRIPKTTKQQSEYVILPAFPRQQWLRQRASMYVASLLTILNIGTSRDGRPLPLTAVWSPQERQRIGVWPRWWRNSDLAEETNSSSSPQAFILLPAPARFQLPPLGGDGQCDKTLKKSKRLDGWVNNCSVFWVEWLSWLLSQNTATCVITRNRERLSHQTKRRLNLLPRYIHFQGRHTLWRWGTAASN